jgi:hydrogenase expression/formation protein HypC
MCLAVPAKLVSRSGTEGIADLHGNRVQISTVLVLDAIPGDWILIHAGFAIQRLSEKDVQETWDLLNEMKVACAANAPIPNPGVPIGGSHDWRAAH